MRRACANSLLAFMTALLFAPFVMAREPSPVPLCCRRDGKHHCSGMMQTLGALSATGDSVSERCPVRNGAQPSSAAVGLPAISAPAAAIEVRDVPELSDARQGFASAVSRHVRGPPLA
jgi:hypothetical protein